jgi:type IV pilus assembly protein PilV
MNRISAAQPRFQRGLSLVETLVSMLILGLGLVGLAALQARTVSYQLGAGQRAQLAGLVSDFGERMRSNLSMAPGQVSKSPYLKNDKLTDEWVTQSAADPAAVSLDCTKANVSCDPKALAEFDKAQWLSAVRRSLPLGSALVDDAGGGAVTVTFMWVDKDRTVDSAAGRVLAQSPTCTTAMSGLDRQSCCPSLAGTVPVGVRCANFSLLP